MQPVVGVFAVANQTDDSDFTVKIWCDHCTDVHTRGVIVLQCDIHTDTSIHTVVHIISDGLTD